MSLLAFTFGTTEIMILVGVMILLFGSARLPSLMRSMGRSITEFKAGMSDKPTDPNIEDKSKDDDDSGNEQK